MPPKAPIPIHFFLTNKVGHTVRHRDTVTDLTAKRKLVHWILVGEVGFCSVDIAVVVAAVRCTPLHVYFSVTIKGHHSCVGT